MSWPTDTLTTTHLDASSDDPSQARAELKATVDAVKAVIAGRATASGVCDLDSSALVPAARLSSAALNTALAGSITTDLDIDGDVTVGDGTGAAWLEVDGAAGNVSGLRFRNGGVNRGKLRLSNTAESGSDAGSELDLLVTDDAGTTDRRVLRAFRATGNLMCGQRTSSDSGAKFHVNTSSSATALLVTQAGTGDALRVEDEATTDSTPLVVDADGRLILGHTTALATHGAAVARTQQHVSGDSANTGALASVLWNGDNVTSGGRVQLARSRSSTIGTHTVVQDDDRLGDVYFAGSDGAAFVTGAAILAVVDGTPSSGVMPAALSLWTASTGAAAERLTVTSAGAVRVLAGPLGYTAGAGGSVTQATSKSTGVTLNKASGRIITHNAALAANTVVSFVLTNSVLAATDTLLIHRSSGGTAGSYRVWVDAIAAGSATICLENLSGGSLSEAVTLNFAVLTGAIT